MRKLGRIFCMRIKDKGMIIVENKKVVLSFKSLFQLNFLVSDARGVNESWPGLDHLRRGTSNKKLQRLNGTMSKDRPNATEGRPYWISTTE